MASVLLDFLVDTIDEVADEKGDVDATVVLLGVATRSIDSTMT